MDELRQKGFANIIILLILIAGLAAGVYLVQNGTKLFSKASVFAPLSPETSFTLVDANGSSCDGILCKIFTQTQVNGSVVKVDLYARSDIEAANLFSAKINFPADLIQVTSIELLKEVPQSPIKSIIQNWVENTYDNSAGTISLTGGVPNPGIKSEVGSPLYIATIIFQAKKEGKGTVSFADKSEIYSNLNNINILTIKRNLDLDISQAAPPSCPVYTPPVPGWCEEGKIVPGIIDKNGCQLPPTCIPGGKICAQVITKACSGEGTATKDAYGNAVYGDPQCKDFPTPCDVPFGWIIQGSATKGPGDGNKDGKINLVDLSVLLSDFNKKSGFRALIDMNGDGIVNSFDFVLLRNILLEKGVIKG